MPSFSSACQRRGELFQQVKKAKESRKRSDKVELRLSLLFLAIVLRPHKWATPIWELLPSLPHTLRPFRTFLLFSRSIQDHPCVASLYVNCLRLGARRKQNPENQRAMHVNQWIPPFIFWCRHCFYLSLSQVWPVSLRDQKMSGFILSAFRYITLLVLAWELVVIVTVWLTG